MLKSLRLALMVGLVLTPLALRSDETPAMQAFYEGVEALQKAAAEPTFQQQQQGWAKAEESFRKAVELKSDYADAYNKLGQSLFNQGKLFDAVTEFKHAVSIDPRLTEAWYHLGYGFENIADEKKVKDDEKAKKKLAKTAAKDAITAYSKAIEVDPSNDIDARARAFFRRGVLERDAAVAAGQKDQANLKPAMLDLEEANKLLTDFPEARNELGRLYDIIGRYPEAIEQFDKAIRGDKNFAEAYSNRGVSWWKAGNWDKALEDTRQATVVDPKFAGGHYNFAEVIFARVQELRLKGGDSDRSVIHLEAQKAVDEYRVCTELDPAFMPGWYGLAKAQHGYHDFDAAEKTYNKILDMDKRQKEAKKLLKDLQKEEKTFTSHIPKEYREGGK
jgi:tetratricopeptide (TPR) repeat protein